MIKPGTATLSFPDTPRPVAAAKTVDKVRLCLDFRKIDSMTRFGAESMCRQGNIFTKPSDSIFFIKLPWSIYRVA